MRVIVKIQRRYYLILFQVVFISLAEIPAFWKLYIMFLSNPEGSVGHWSGYYNTLRLARAM